MVAARRYIPDRGDVVWMQFSPHEGHEQAGKRPALVLSPKSYNAKTGLALVCPITSQSKGYPFEVVVTSKKICGSILSDHIRNLDWSARKAVFIEKFSTEIVGEVTEKIKLIISDFS